MKRLSAIALLCALTGLVFMPAAAEATLCNCQDCVVAVYFHNSVRCATCRTIEAYTKEAIETSFKDEIASGKLCFRVIDTDENGNRHYMNDYGLYTKAVVVTLVKDGRELKFDNLQKVWELTGNKDAFMRYVENAVAGYLKEL